MRANETNVYAMQENDSDRFPAPASRESLTNLVTPLGRRTVLCGVFQSDGRDPLQLGQAALPRCTVHAGCTVVLPLQIAARVRTASHASTTWQPRTMALSLSRQGYYQGIK